MFINLAIILAGNGKWKDTRGVLSVNSARPGILSPAGRGENR